MSFAVESRPPCALVKANISAADGCHHHHCKRLYPDGPSIGFHVAIQPWLRSLSRFPCVLGPPIPGDDVLPHRGALGSRLPQLTISTFHLSPSPPFSRGDCHLGPSAITGQSLRPLQPHHAESRGCACRGASRRRGTGHRSFFSATILRNMGRQSARLREGRTTLGGVGGVG